jgi:hypothetical protein
MALSDDLERIAGAATSHAAAGETVAAILTTESPNGERTYVCAFSDGARRRWLAFDDTGAPVVARNRVREAVSVAALHEVAAEVGEAAQHVPSVATLASLDDLGTQDPGVATAIRDAMASVEELAKEVEKNYKLPLAGA